MPKQCLRRLQPPPLCSLPCQLSSLLHQPLAPHPWSHPPSRPPPADSRPMGVPRPPLSLSLSHMCPSLGNMAVHCCAPLDTTGSSQPTRLFRVCCAASGLSAACKPLCSRHCWTIPVTHNSHTLVAHVQVCREAQASAEHSVAAELQSAARLPQSSAEGAPPHRV